MPSGDAIRMRNAVIGAGPGAPGRERARADASHGRDPVRRFGTRRFARSSPGSPVSRQGHVRRGRASAVRWERGRPGPVGFCDGWLLETLIRHCQSPPGRQPVQIALSPFRFPSITAPRGIGKCRFARDSCPRCMTWKRSDAGATARLPFRRSPARSARRSRAGRHDRLSLSTCRPNCMAHPDRCQRHRRRALPRGRHPGGDPGPAQRDLRQPPDPLTARGAPVRIPAPGGQRSRRGIASLISNAGPRHPPGPALDGRRRGPERPPCVDDVSQVRWRGCCLPGRGDA